MRAIDGLRLPPQAIVENSVAKTTLRRVFFLVRGSEGIHPIDAKAALSKMISASFEVQPLHPTTMLYMYERNGEDLDPLNLAERQIRIYKGVLTQAKAFVVAGNHRSYADQILSLLTEDS